MMSTISKPAMRMLTVSIFFAVASLAWGYNIGIMASIYVHPGFQQSLMNPSKTMTGYITSIYYVGTLFSYLFVAHPLADAYGRRLAAAAGVLITSFGAIIQASAHGAAGISVMMAGRIICGVGLAIVSTSVPLYQSEVSPAKHRGRYVVINHVGLVVGIATAFWAGYGLSHWTTVAGAYYGWRLSMLLQLLPEGLFLFGVFLCPESPRWLVEHSKDADAKESLAWLRATSPSHEQIRSELLDIEEEAQHRHLTSHQDWTVLFTQKHLFRRLWRASLLHFMGQACGNVSLKYYLPTVLMGLGIPRQTTLLIGGIETTLKIGFSIIDSWWIDRYGRILTLVVSCFIMSISLLINGALPIIYPGNVNPAADYTCIVFIFIYTFAFSIGFGPAGWVYGSEIFPTTVRARGLNIAAAASSIGAMLSSQIWPVGIQKIGSKTHFIFMTTNVVSGIVIWLFFPETSGRSLEEMGTLFKDQVNDFSDDTIFQEEYHDDDGSDGDNDQQPHELAPLYTDRE